MYTRKVAFPKKVRSVIIILTPMGSQTPFINPHLQAVGDSLRVHTSLEMSWEDVNNLLEAIKTARFKDCGQNTVPQRWRIQAVGFLTEVLGTITPIDTLYGIGDKSFAL